MADMNDDSDYVAPAPTTNLPKKGMSDSLTTDDGLPSYDDLSDDEKALYGDRMGYAKHRLNAAINAAKNSGNTY
jgi:hypothetical protein